MAYMDVQPKNPNQQTILLLQGKNFNGAYWGETARALAAEGFRVEWWYQSELDKDYESIKNYQLQSYYDGQWKPEYEPWVSTLAGCTKNIDYPLIAWNAALTYDMIFTQPVLYEFEQLQAPTLLIIGQRDRTALGKNLVSEEVRKTLGNYPELGKATARKIKNSRLVELDNIGHLPHIEAFDRFIDPLLRFLKE